MGCGDLKEISESPLGSSALGTGKASALLSSWLDEAFYGIAACLMLLFVFSVIVFLGGAYCC